MTDISPNPTARETAREMLVNNGVLYSPQAYRDVIGRLLADLDIHRGKDLALARALRCAILNEK